MSSPTSAPSPWPQRLRAALWIWLVWTFLGLFYFSQTLVQMGLNHDPTPWWHPLTSWMSGVWIAALATPVILALGRRFPIRRKSWLGPSLVHLALSIGFGLVQILLQALVISGLHIFPNVMKGPATAFVVLFMIGFHQSMFTYWEVLAVQAGWDFYRGYLDRREEASRLQLRAAELQSQLANAQLGALKAQLQPHFLFNTLNAIVSLVHQGQNAQAETMLGRLADLLRCVLEDGGSHEVPLRREFEYLRLYLAIEEVRFQDRLRAEVSADEGLLDALVPHLCLQPVVENAIRHGLSRRAAAGRVAVRAWREGDALVLCVEDDGPGFAAPGASSSASSGIGLANTRARLVQLYGDAAALDLGAAEPCGARVTITLPYRVDDAVPHGEGVAYAVQLSDRR